MADITYVDPDYTTNDNILTTLPDVSWAINDGALAGGRMLILAHSDSNKAYWYLQFCASNDNGTVTIHSQNLGLSTYKTLGAALWDVNLIGDNGNLKVQVKGSNGQNINWHVNVMLGSAQMYAG